MKKLIYIFGFSLGLVANIIATGALAQSKLQVITRKVEKDMQYMPSETIKIEGEKASIKLHTWNSKDIKVILRQVAKGTDKDMATKELEYHRYIMEKRKGTIYIKNYFAIPKGTQRVKSLLLSEYEIWLPASAKLDVENSYGNVTASGLQNKTSIELKYGDLNLSDIAGDLEVKGYFGNFSGQAINARFNGSFNHTKINLDGISGIWDMRTTLGDVVINKITDLKTIKISASKADITVKVPPIEAINISLEANYGEILVPERYTAHFGRFTESKKSLEYGRIGSSPSFQLSTSFGKIIITE
ncbi:MAG: DUF4097 family beta strand repeat-containing protein [Bacteroidota bacterium]